MIDWRHLPSLTALRAFSAFAEHGTLERAGSAIGVTHAAVSQQIRALETHLGLKLVERSGRHIRPSPDGMVLANALADAFGKISTVMEGLTQAETMRPLKVTATPAFASGWLLPRLARFREAQPDVGLAIDPTPDLRRLPEDADIALRYGSGDWPGVTARLLLRTPLVVVVSPVIVPEGRDLTIEAAADLPWLQELGTNETTTFFAERGHPRIKGAQLTSLPGNLMLDAARDGQGVAVVARAFVEADISAGRLHVLHEDAEHEGYFLVTAPGPSRKPVEAFCRWALREARGD